MAWDFIKKEKNFFEKHREQLLLNFIFGDSSSKHSKILLNECIGTPSEQTLSLFALTQKICTRPWKPQQNMLGSLKKHDKFFLSKDLF